MARDIDVSDRRHWFRVWENCFSGKDAVHWMLDQAVVDSEAAALELGNLMLNAGLIHHVVEKHRFHNKRLFYRFRLDLLAAPCTGPRVARGDPSASSSPDPDVQTFVYGDVLLSGARACTR